MQPLPLLSLGAGVQSSTLALMAAAGLVTPMPAAAIFADTQAEPASVYQWLDWLEAQLPFPVYRVTAGSLEAAELTVRTSRKSGKVYRHSLIPAYGEGKGGIFPRKCTRDYKVYPITRKARELVGREALTAWRTTHRTDLSVINHATRQRRDERVHPAEAWARVHADAPVSQWIGISIDEAIRVKDSREPWAVNRYPLIEQRISRADCLAWMAAQGYPTPPRSACVFCPYHNDQEWIRLRDQEPEAFARAVDFERRVRDAAQHDQVTRYLPFLHESRQPLDQVVFDAQRTRKPRNLFENECEGRCGV